MKIWLILLGAIVAEVIATTALRGSDGLRKLGPYWCSGSGGKRQGAVALRRTSGKMIV